MNGLEAISCLLERQDNLEKYGSSGGFSIKKQREMYEAIEKGLKVLEIIDKKNVNIGLLKICDNLGSYHYRMDERRTECKPLTQDEFDLLKEVLE